MKCHYTLIYGVYRIALKIRNYATERTGDVSKRLSEKGNTKATNTNERRLSLFERKLLRCICGAKQENGTWQKRYNHELYEIFNESKMGTNYTSIHINLLSNDGNDGYMFRPL
jgi:hypothetical protein